MSFNGLYHRRFVGPKRRALIRNKKLNFKNDGSLGLVLDEQIFKKLSQFRKIKTNSYFGFFIQKKKNFDYFIATVKTEEE